jgi:hypothetical protein
MKPDELRRRLEELALEELPLAGGGDTRVRFERLVAIGREDLSLAKLAEAHWDAVAILHEAGRTAEHGTVYGVWASEIPGEQISLEEHSIGYVVRGSKRFCSGLGVIDRALLSTEAPKGYLLDVDMRAQNDRIQTDTTMWSTEAFRGTNTGRVEFHDYCIGAKDVCGAQGFYLSREGFWHGACGVAACWAGGAAGLLDYAHRSKRNDAHTLAHLGAMDATVWSMKALLDQAGREIDCCADDERAAHTRALRLRHSIEQGCTEVLRRFARAYGPHPLAMDPETSRRYHELELYLRQNHGERDLEALGHVIQENP